ncbi:MAG: CheR family methyltransferase [Polyangia bacterium]
MTTHETFFFRDLPAWQTFEELVVPTLLASRRAGLRIWSAACSDGQEPYSIAMLLEERWPAIAAASTIVATDVSAPAIERASAGVYSVFDVNRGLGAARLLRHFDRASTGGFRVRRPLRERVTWQVASILDGGPRGAAFDVVFCRNVLIYFNDADRLSVLRSLSAKTKPDGFVALGVSEVVSAKSIGPGWYQNGLFARAMTDPRPDPAALLVR